MSEPVQARRQVGADCFLAARSPCCRRDSLLGGTLRERALHTPSKKAYMTPATVMPAWYMRMTRAAALSIPGSAKDAAWMSSEIAAGWSGVQAIPRILYLDDKSRLCSRPVPEFETLRGKHYHFDAHEIDDAPLPVSGLSLDIEAEIDVNAAETCGIKVALCRRMVANMRRSSMKEALTDVANPKAIQPRQSGHRQLYTRFGAHSGPRRDAKAAHLAGWFRAGSHRQWPRQHYQPHVSVQRRKSSCQCHRVGSAD